MPRWEWTPEQDSTLREHHALGKTQQQAADQIGCTRPNISRRAKRLGILWQEPSPAIQAMRQKNADRSAQARAQLAAAVLADAINIRERIWDQYTVIVSTPHGPVTEILDLPDAKAVAEFTAAVERLIKSHENLTRMGAGQDADVAKSMLNELFEQVKKLADEKE